MPISPLDSLLERKRALEAGLIAVFPIPVWSDPSMYLQVKVLDQNVISRIMDPVEKAGRRNKSEAHLNACASVVAAATLKVLVGDGEDQAEIPLRAIAEKFGLDDTATAAQVIRTVCFRDGDVIALSGKVAEHSGYGGQEIEEVFLGE